MAVWVLGGLAAVVLLYGILLYNRLVARRNQVRNAWSQIDVQLKRRHDLIPNLVNTAKGYLTHEQGVLERVVKARQRAIGAGDDVAARAASENQLTGALRSLFALAE
ncbi:MAG TPA: LemA family protein, partial [Geminicoccaceae bacterium]